MLSRVGRVNALHRPEVNVNLRHHAIVPGTSEAVASEGGFILNCLGT